MLIFSVFVGMAMSSSKAMGGPQTIKVGESEFRLSRDGPFMDDQGSSVGRFACVGVAAFALIAVGAVLSRVGKSGLAGSGIVLDPQQARRDLEPHVRAMGGMLADGLEEVPQLSRGTTEVVTEVVKVRCPECKSLNEEQAKFCSRCGKAL